MLKEFDDNFDILTKTEKNNLWYIDKFSVCKFIVMKNNDDEYYYYLKNDCFTDKELLKVTDGEIIAKFKTKKEAKNFLKTKIYNN